MNDQERQQDFLAAMQQAEAQYGFTLISTIQVEGLGVIRQLTNTLLSQVGVDNAG